MAEEEVEPNEHIRIKQIQHDGHPWFLIALDLPAMRVLSTLTMHVICYGTDHDKNWASLIIQYLTKTASNLNVGYGTVQGTGKNHNCIEMYLGENPLTYAAKGWLSTERSESDDY